jgi:PAS domain S-box-containing protein
MAVVSHQQIQILHVDDEPDFTDLTKSVLQNEDNQFVVETATRAEEGLARVEEYRPDCIVSDYNMPEMNGLEFLGRVREEYPYLPFILFTGQGSEDVASNAIAADATDYLQKGSGSEKFELLANRIRNAVQARREARRADRQEQLMRLTEFAGETGGFELDRESDSILLTAGTRRIIGRPNKHEMRIEDMVDLFHPDERGDIRQVLDRAFEEGEHIQTQWHLQSGDSDERLLDITITPVVENGTVSKIRGVCHDITGRRARQRELNQIETLFKHAQDSLFLIGVDEGFTVERVNPAYEDATGLSAERVCGQTPRDILGEQSGAFAESKYEECVTNQEPLEYRESARINDSISHWETRIAPVVIDGTVEYIAGSTRNITEQKERQETLEQTSDLLANMEELADAGAWEYDAETEQLMITDGIRRLYGLDPGADLTLESALDAIHPEDQNLLRDRFNTCIDMGEPYDVDVRLTTTDGDQRWITVQAERISESGESSVVRGSIRDITDQYEYERDLKRYQTVFNEFPDPIVVYDEEGRYGLANEAAAELRNVSPGDLSGTKSPYLQQIKQGHPHKYEALINGERDALQAEVTDEFPGRGKRIFACDLFRVTNETGQASTGIITRDVTEQKERERELKRKSRAIEAAPVGITMTDPKKIDNPITYVNQKFLETSGYDQEEVLGRNCRLMQGPETDPETVATIRDGIDAEEHVSAKIKNYRKDGTEFWNHLDIAPVHNEDGDLINFIGFQQDVTDRVEYERALEESRNRYRTLVEHFPNGAVTLVDETLRYVTVGGAPIDEARDGERDLTGQPLEEALTDEMERVLRPKYVDALDGDKSTFEAEVAGRWYQFQIVPVYDDDGSVFAAMGVSQDITEQKDRERSLQKRERVLRELHTATRKFYPPNSIDEVPSFIVDFLQSTFNFSYVSVKRIDEEDGVLRPAAASATFNAEFENFGAIEPGENPLWEAYRTGESVEFRGELLTQLFDTDDSSVERCLAVPIGNFGLIVVATSGGKSFDNADRDLIEVLATNAEAVFQNLQHEEERAILESEIKTQQHALDELRGIIDAIQKLQRRVANSESVEELEQGVCEELIETERIDLAWIGHPETSDSDLTATAWAGDQTGYLDSVLPDADDVLLPAQHAATTRDSYHLPNVSERVHDDDWVKDALSAQYGSVLSVPMIYEGVLYGVLTVYTTVQDGFEQFYKEFVRDVASLVVTYTQILEQRYIGADEEFVQLEFRLDDSGYPLQRLATETASQIQFDTVTDTRESTVHLLVTVTEGDPETVLNQAKDQPTFVEATQLGDNDSRQLHLAVEQPFLTSDVAKHGGRLLKAVSDESGSEIRINVPQTSSKRPLLEALTNRYRDMDLVAQRQTRRDIPTKDTLTERQREILNAAYHSGYYETPRDITGEDLAQAFDISGPTLYKHLQEAHRKIVEELLE